MRQIYGLVTNKSLLNPKYFYKLMLKLNKDGGKNYKKLVMVVFKPWKVIFDTGF
jgi:hypothetical protein